jgi:hypothetical protein
VAVTIAFTKEGVIERLGRSKVVSGYLTPTGTYETGGIAVTASTFELSTLDSLQVSTAHNGTEFMVTKYVPSTGKIILGWTGGATGSELDEITNADTVTDFVMAVQARGK